MLSHLLENILPKGHKCAPPGNSHWVVTMGPKVISMLSHSCLKIVPKLPPSCLQSCPEVVLRLSLSCLKIVFFLTYLQVVSRLSPSGVKGNHSCESTWLIIQSQFTRKGKTIIMATAQSMTNNRTSGKMERKRKKQHTGQQLFEGVEHRWQKMKKKIEK